MLHPTRQPPRLGARARVVHFGGTTEVGVISAVRDGGRVLEVLCEAGERIEFALNPATAQFAGLGAGSGARLDLLGAPQGT